ncbi:MAG TPA: tetratricopeptide repeat protein [Terriglobia bacterium]|nr:tetratricopeptide repeat protein [Terriglobia bacterium]
MSLFLSLLTASFLVSSAAQSPQGSANNAQQLIAKARAAEQKRDFQVAAELYQDYLDTHPNDSEILQRLGLVNCLSNRFEAAIPPLEKALQLDSSLWGSALYLGISYYHTGRFADATAVLKRALTLKPDLTDADFWLGASLLFTDQPESAIPHLLRASKNPKLNAQAQYFLVKAYRKAAKDHYQGISTVAPDSCLVHLVKAQFLAWRGSNNGAVWEAREALKRVPTYLTDLPANFISVGIARRSSCFVYAG